MKKKKKNFLINNFSNLNFKNGSNLIFAEEYLYNLYQKKDLKNYNCSFTNKINLHENFNYKNSIKLKKKLKIYRKEIADQLNFYHRTNLSVDYWGYIIDYFLIILITSIQKEIKFVKNVKRKFKNIWISDFHFNEIFYDSRAAQGYITLNQNYVKLIRNIISQEIGINAKSNKTKITIKNEIYGEKSIFNFIPNLLNFFIRSWILFFKPILILDGAFGWKNSLKIFIKTFGRIILLPSKLFFNKKKYSFIIDKKFRKNIKVKQRDFFDKIFNLLVGILFPVTFLEAFNFTRNQDIIFSKKITKIGTGINMIVNDKFKFLSAEILKNNGKLLSFQHGGNFEKTKLLLAEMIEKKYATKRYLWSDKKGTGQHFLTKYKKLSLSNIKKNKNILIFPTVISYQNFVISNLDRNNHPYLNQSYDFFKHLKQENKNNVIVKLFPSYESDKTKKIWNEKFKNSINFAETFSKNLNFYDSRIVVINDISTPLYELMYIGVPFIIITDNKFNEFKKKFEKDLRNLEDLNILYRNPIKAAEFVNKNYSKIIEWWAATSKKKKFINFKKNLFVEKNDHVNLIINDLIKL